jgi:hypothetical protein
MDTFIEQLVVKKFDASDKIKIALLTIALVLAVILIFLLINLSIFQAFAFMGILFEFGVCYGYWYLITSFRVEFEYALTNGELDVDKIISKRKRKRLITVKIREVEIMARVTSNNKNEFFNQSFKTVLDASSSPLSPNAFFISVHNNKLGHTKLIFEPDQRIIDICKSVAPRKVFDK